MNLTSHAQTHRGAVRKINEDALLELCHSKIWVVADGMGGHEAGDIASQLVIDTVEDAILAAENQCITLSILKEALFKANSDLQSMVASHFNGNVAGSTVVILWIDRDEYHYLWVGDSRGYLMRNGILFQITKDHSQVNEMVDEGIITIDEAESHPLANVITRAVGVDDSLDVDIISGQLQENDIFLLCSDGLNKELSNKEIEKTLGSGKIIDAGMALMHAALVRNARDNVTCVLVKNNDYNKSSHMNENDRTVPLFI